MNINNFNSKHKNCLNKKNKQILHDLQYPSSTLQDLSPPKISPPIVDIF